MKLLSALLLSLQLVTTTTNADSFTLQSQDISAGKYMDKTHEFNGFGCSGKDLSPQLSWSNAPSGTAAFAVTVYDPDAPTGSGWWHWQIFNIPANIHSLARGAGNLSNDLAPKKSMQSINDYGVKGFGGACPPKGHGNHRYQFKVHALSKQLDIPENASGALVGYIVNSHTLATATLEALYRRD